MDTQTIADTIRCAAPEALDGIAQSIYGLLGMSRMSDEDASELLTLVQARRRTARAGEETRPPRSDWGRYWNQRRRQPRPERTALVARRRAVASCGLLPPRLANQFTEAERAVIGVIGDRIRQHGFCDLYLDQIGALAGASRSTCQNAIRHAKDIGLIDVTLRPVRGRGKKSRTNLITIRSVEWKAWLARRKGRVTEFWSLNPFDPMPTTKDSRLCGGRLTLAESPGPGASAGGGRQAMH